MERSSVDTAFGIAFITIAVVILYPTVFMFLYDTFGPNPPQLTVKVESPEVMTFMGLTIAWFIAGVVIPFGVAFAVMKLARRIFQEARGGVLKVSAILSVILLYGAFTLFNIGAF